MATAGPDAAPDPAPPLYLDELVDGALLADSIERGLVSVRDAGDLRIYNYTPRATYTRAWNPATLLCRGLIVDDKDRVLARPFPKFFNPDEPDAPTKPPGAPMVVAEKLDGSLGIAYHHPGGDVRLATRGSLTSDQAVEATAIWREKYRHVRFDKGITPLFEIIYPANRVVVDYGKTRDLVLLAAIDIRTGADLPLGRIDWPGPVAGTQRVRSLGELMDHVVAGDVYGREGYVVRFDMGPDRPHIRFKLKFPEYVVAHRFVTGLTSLRVWEVVAIADTLKRGLDIRTAATRLRINPETVEATARRGPDPVGSLRGDLPEEFWTWYDATVDEYRSSFRDLVGRYRRLVRQARAKSGATGGRPFAEAAMRLSSEQGIPTGPIFALNKGREETYASIWTQLRPSEGGDRPRTG